MARKEREGFVSLVMTADDKNMRMMLEKLHFSLSGPAMAGFLSMTVDPYLRARAKNRFAEEGDDVTGKWEPLLGATQHIRASQGYGAAHPINVRTGRLENYITGTAGRAVPNPIGATLTFPGKPPLGMMHTKVKTAQRGKLAPRTPPRPVLGVNERDLLAVLTDLSLYLGTGMFR